MLLVLALPAALAAAPGIPLQPPVPITGQPWGALVTAWALPPQTPGYLVEEVERLDCPVAVTLQPDGTPTPDAAACPESMRQAALDAALQWTFQPVEPTDQPTLLGLLFVVRYNASLGAMTLSAELDPGSAHATEEGRPGLKLVRPASLAAPVQVKLKGKQRKAGLGPTTCALRARVTAAGQVTETLVVDCPAALSPDAEARLRDARWRPGRIDGQLVEDVVDATVSYR